MKKKWLTMLMVLFTPLLIAGCAKAIPAEEAAPLLIDAMIYQKEDETFNESFAESETLTQAFAKHRTSFEENFTTGLLQSNEAVDEATAEKISELLMVQVKKVTSYQVKKLVETENIHHVTYEIKGFDLSGLLAQTTKELLTRIQKDNTIAKDEAKMVANTIEIVESELPKISAKETATEVTLQLKAKRGKWEIVAGQDETLAQLYLAFYAGLNNQEALTKEMNEAIAGVEVPSMGEPEAAK